MSWPSIVDFASLIDRCWLVLAGWWLVSSLFGQLAGWEIDGLCGVLVCWHSNTFARNSLNTPTTWPQNSKHHAPGLQSVGVSETWTICLTLQTKEPARRTAWHTVAPRLQTVGFHLQPETWAIRLTLQIKRPPGRQCVAQQSTHASSQQHRVHA